MPLDHFRTALVIDEDPVRAADRIAAELMSQGCGGTIGFVYITDRLNSGIEPVVASLRQKTGVANWIGTIGFGVISGRGAAYNQPAIAAMIGHWSPDQFKLFNGQSPSDVGHWADKGMATAIVHVDPRFPFDADLRQLAATSRAYLFGGLTASRARRFDQFADGVTEGGASGLMLGPDVEVAVGVSQGCSAIGPVRTITEMEDNMVTSLDGEPSLQALVRDLSVTPDGDIAKLLRSLHVGLPVPNCDTGDFVVRNFAGIDTDKGLIAIADHVEPGQKIFFCRRDRAAATKDLLAMAQKLRKRTATVRGGLYVTCCARGPNLFDSATEEAELLQSALGDVPLVGFFANGEVAGDRIYGYTGVLALF
ncbi:FIST signal transduction protein [Methylocapsa aurea]|uniref:FIST signal transduction protein n=1 Tax=Methylocapsa aurea TaxID=663610 RepID=UPI000690C192|nr:FIST N-terminal domain-containing protein [Methylocapsa aurea]